MFLIEKYFRRKIFAKNWRVFYEESTNCLSNTNQIIWSQSYDRELYIQRHIQQRCKITQHNKWPNAFADEIAFLNSKNTPGYKNAQQQYLNAAVASDRWLTSAVKMSSYYTFFKYDRRWESFKTLLPKQIKNRENGWQFF
jgi:hypothetical protein